MSVDNLTDAMNNMSIDSATESVNDDTKNTHVVDPNTKQWRVFISYLYQWQPNIGVNHTELVGNSISVWFNDKYDDDFVKVVACYNRYNPDKPVQYKLYKKEGFYNTKYHITIVNVRAIHPRSLGQ
jgi:hypothetical protein